MRQYWVGSREGERQLLPHDLLALSLHQTRKNNYEDKLGEHYKPTANIKKLEKEKE